MSGILEGINEIVNPNNATILGNAALESEVVLGFLMDACESLDEYAELLDSAATEMALYGVIDDASIATEVVKKIQVTDWKQANFNRIAKRTAIRLAMVNGDPLYTKYKKYRELLIATREKIYKKYGNKARVEARKIIKNSRNKAANMNSDAGHAITKKMDEAIAAVETKK